MVRLSDPLAHAWIAEAAEGQPRVRRVEVEQAVAHVLPKPLVVVTLWKQGCDGSIEGSLSVPRVHMVPIVGGVESSTEVLDSDADQREREIWVMWDYVLNFVDQDVLDEGSREHGR